MASFKDTIKRTLAGAAIIAATALPSFSQSNVEIMQTADRSTSRIRPNLFYQLPGEVKGYTFMEFYQDGKNYLAKTSLNRNIKGGLDAKLQMTNGSQFTDNVGIGLEYKMPAGESTTIKVKALPLYMDFDGTFDKRKAIAGLYINQKLDLPLIHDVNIIGFGEVNMTAEGGPQWSYGELHAQKQLGDYVIGLGMDLRRSGRFLPKPNCSAKISYVFGK